MRMLPKVIVFNSVSLDGAIKDFQVDVALHYEVLAKIGLDALLAALIPPKQASKRLSLQCLLRRKVISNPSATQTKTPFGGLYPTAEAA